MVDLIEATVFPMLPDFDPKCCQACGYDCRTLCHRIIAGQSVYEDCVIKHTNLQLKIDGKEIKMVPFVEKILLNSVLAVVSELEGYKKNGSIEISWAREDGQ